MRFEDRGNKHEITLILPQQTEVIILLETAG